MGNGRAGPLPLKASAAWVRRKPRLHLAAELVPSGTVLERDFEQSSPPAYAGRSGSATAEHHAALMPAPAAQPSRGGTQTSVPLFTMESPCRASTDAVPRQPPELARRCPQRVSCEPFDGCR